MGNKHTGFASTDKGIPHRKMDTKVLRKKNVHKKSGGITTGNAHVGK